MVADSLLGGIDKIRDHLVANPIETKRMILLSCELTGNYHLLQNTNLLIEKYKMQEILKNETLFFDCLYRTTKTKLGHFQKELWGWDQAAER